MPSAPVIVVDEPPAPAVAQPSTSASSGGPQASASCSSQALGVSESHRMYALRSPRRAFRNEGRGTSAAADQLLPESGPNPVDSAHPGLSSWADSTRTPANLGPNRSDVCPHRQFGQSWANIKPKPISIALGQTGRARPNLGRIWPNLVGIRRSLCQFRPESADFGRHRASGARRIKSSGRGGAQSTRWPGLARMSRRPFSAAGLVLGWLMISAALERPR